MINIIVADASALQAMPSLCSAENKIQMMSEMTTRVEDGDLCFPRAVALDLRTTARDEPIASWASGLGRSLDPYKADIKYMRPLMGYVKQCGYEDGFDSLTGEEPSIADVGRLACRYQAEGKNFVIASEDTGEGPLSPTMEQLCAAASWNMIDAREALTCLGLSSYLS
ncbi:hypothetical protein [Rhodococcus rhodochrous]|uniref:hypothetical protein n=1 Tax=Rhodococcus rhodochrous TaxID=1829 RepID=UPI00177C9B7E|nr:hypothetical protein [Rhodococcus rhodochrous]